MQCNLCGKPEFKLLYKGTLSDEHPERFARYALYGDLYRCVTCGLVHQRLNHKVDEIVALLKKERYLDEAIGELNYREKAVQFRQLMAEINRFTRLAGASVLDMGANISSTRWSCWAA